MIEYRFRVPNTVIFTLYSYSKVLKYRLEYRTADSVWIHSHRTVYYSTRVGGRVRRHGRQVLGRPALHPHLMGSTAGGLQVTLQSSMDTMALFSS
jgi:hypothetical protein